MRRDLMRLGGIGGLAAALTIAACGGGNIDTVPGAASTEPQAAAEDELPFPRGDSASGAEIFASTCAVCHGPAGNGDPGVAPGLDSPWHAWEHPDRQIRDWVRDGKFGLRVNMPGYGDKLDEQAISDVIAYVRTLWTQEQRDVQRDVSLRYEEGYRRYPPQQ